MTAITETRIVDAQPYNTNNAWGFGGSYGTEYRWSDGWRLRVGTACYRHLKSHPIRYAVSPEGVRYLDLHEIKKRPGGLPEHVWAKAKGSRR